MKSLQLYLSPCLLFLFLLSLARAQQVQHPLINTATDPILEDNIPEYVFAGSDEDPAPAPPPPIWSLCGEPSKHLLIPYNDMF